MEFFRRWLQGTKKQSHGPETPAAPPPAERAPYAAPPPLKPGPPAFDLTPDPPETFGYKVSWFALKTSDPATVRDALQLGDAVPANWASGMVAAYGRAEGDWVFISPPLGGWVLAISSSWVYPTIQTHHDIGAKFDRLFSRLMTRFDDVQFFGSHRVSDFTAWARAVNGKPVRIFSWAGSDGAVFMNEGDRTPEEARLGLLDLTGLSPDAATEAIFQAAEEEDEDEDNRTKSFPEEDDVVALAARFGASIPSNCRSRTIRALWDWRAACRTI